MSGRSAKDAEALGSLYSMFGNLEHMVVDAVYEANHGNMERVLDQLLEISEQLVESVDDTSNEALKDSEENVKTEKPEYRNRLPENFLSISRVSSQLKKDSFSCLVNSKKDLARLLENEMFQSELREHEEFLSFLQKLDAEDHTGYLDSTECRPSLRQFYDELGEAAQIKFNALAIRFKRALDANSGEDYKFLFARKSNEEALIQLGESSGSFGTASLARRRNPGLSDSIQGSKITPEKNGHRLKAS